MEVKGLALIPMKDYVTSNFKARYQEWINALSPEAQAIVTNPLASSWYPLQTALIEPTQKICSLFHQGSEQGAWQLGRFSADHALKGIYSFFVKLGSPGFIASRGSRIICQYYQPCEIKVIENRPKLVILHMTRFEQPNRLVELRIGGWMERAIEISGKKSAVKITRSLVDGESVTEYIVDWE